jgi:hypothetical protein
MGHGRLDSILGSYSIPGIDFSCHNPSNNTGFGYYSVQYILQCLPFRGGGGGGGKFFYL